MHPLIWFFSAPTRIRVRKLLGRIPLERVWGFWEAVSYSGIMVGLEEGFEVYVTRLFCFDLFMWGWICFDLIHSRRRCLKDRKRSFDWLIILFATYKSEKFIHSFNIYNVTYTYLQDISEVSIVIIGWTKFEIDIETNNKVILPSWK